MPVTWQLHAFDGSSDPHWSEVFLTSENDRETVLSYMPVTLKLHGNKIINDWFDWIHQNGCLTKRVLQLHARYMAVTCPVAVDLLWFRELVKRFSYYAIDLDCFAWLGQIEIAWTLTEIHSIGMPMKRWWISSHWQKRGTKFLTFTSCEQWGQKKVSPAVITKSDHSFLLISLLVKDLL